MSVYLGSNKIGDSINKNNNRFIKIVSGQLEELNPNDFYDLEEIKERQFYCNEGIKRVCFSENIKIIGGESFFQSKDLEEVSFSSSVEKINEKAFQECKNLKKVFLNSKTPPIIYFNTFDDDYEGSFFIPNGSLELYKNAYRWSDYADKFIEMEV